MFMLRCEILLCIISYFGLPYSLLVRRIVIYSTTIERIRYLGYVAPLTYDEAGIRDYVGKYFVLLTFSCDRHERLQNE